MRKPAAPALTLSDETVGDSAPVDAAARDSAVSDVQGERDMRGLLAANRRFYKAFADRDLTTMEQLWSHDVEIACIHPGWPALTGRERVMRSWQELMLTTRTPAIRCGAEKATVLGDLGLVICEEYVSSTTVAVTNLFTRTDKGWALIHHQASAVSTAVTDDGLSSDDLGLDDFLDVPHTLH